MNSNSKSLKATFSLAHQRFLILRQNQWEDPRQARQMINLSLLESKLWTLRTGYLRNKTALKLKNLLVRRQLLLKWEKFWKNLKRSIRN